MKVLRNISACSPCSPISHPQFVTTKILDFTYQWRSAGLAARVAVVPSRGPHSPNRSANDSCSVAEGEPRPGAGDLIPPMVTLPNVRGLQLPGWQWVPRHCPSP